MNTNENLTPGTTQTFMNACERSCQKLVAKIQAVRRALSSEFGQGVRARDRMVELALNEAEGLAHQTEFPLLVFPTLAREKVEALATWDRRQRALRISSLAWAAA
jgi:hypothetical protein